MITREDILAMTEEDFKHWWNEDRIQEVNSSIQFSGYQDYIKFWFDFHQKFNPFVPQKH